MAALVERDAAFVSRLRRSQRPLAVTGLVLALLGAAYCTWGVLRFDPRVDPRTDPGFDTPVARLAFVFERGEWMVENATPDTAEEARLLRVLAHNMRFSAGVMVLLLRLFLGTLALVTGMVAMTVVVERARLLRLIKQLEE